MRHKLIDWVDARCRLWGYQQRKLDLKQEDWPESVWARIVDGIPPGQFCDQTYLEVFEGDALIVARCLPVLTEMQRAHVYVYYVIPQPNKVKIERLGRSRENYYATLADAHRKLSVAMQGLTRSTVEQSTRFLYTGT